MTVYHKFTHKRCSITGPEIDNVNMRLMSNLTRSGVKFWLIIHLLCTATAFAGPIEVVLPPLEVSKANVNVFSKPIAYHKGRIYTVNVEPALDINNGLNLRTVVRTGKRNQAGYWQWEHYVLEPGTLDDPYHTQASIAVDRDGFVHVAYNMHNMPWQYAVTRRPGDITDFEFRGRPLSLKDKITVKHLNKTPFPSTGKSFIPGNQVTYPAFFYDRNRDLYISYRFALRPMRPFKDRWFSGGIAKYDTRTKAWHPMGGRVTITQNDAKLSGGSNNADIAVFAVSDRWTVYLPRLAFGPNNEMHVSWTWRKGVAGADVTHPSYAISADNGVTFHRSDGTAYQMPISVEKSGLFVEGNPSDKYYALTDIAVNADNIPNIVFSIVGISPHLTYFNKLKNRWEEPKRSPFGATDIEFDSHGRLWAFASGQTISLRESNSGPWKRVYAEEGSVNRYGYPKVLVVPEEEMFLAHYQSTDLTKVKIVSVKWNEF